VIRWYFISENNNVPLNTVNNKINLPKKYSDFHEIRNEISIQGFKERIKQLKSNFLENIQKEEYCNNCTKFLKGENENFTIKCLDLSNTEIYFIVSKKLSGLATPKIGGIYKVLEISSPTGEGDESYRTITPVKIDHDTNFQQVVEQIKIYKKYNNDFLNVDKNNSIQITYLNSNNIANIRIIEPSIIEKPEEYEYAYGFIQNANIQVTNSQIWHCTLQLFWYKKNNDIPKLNDYYNVNKHFEKTSLCNIALESPPGGRNFKSDDFLNKLGCYESSTRRIRVVENIDNEERIPEEIKEKFKKVKEELNKKRKDDKNKLD